MTNSLNKTADALERQYNLFINQTDYYHFFLGLNDYLNYMTGVPFLVSVMQETFKDRDTEYALLEKLENQALDEVKSAKKRLFEIVEKNKIQSGQLTIALQDIRNFENAKMQIFTDNNFVSGAWSSVLFSAATIISEMGQREILNEFIVSDKEYRKYSGANSNIYGNFVFSKAITKRRHQWDKIKELEREEIWGVTDKALNFHEAWKNYRNINTNPELIWAPEDYLESDSLQERRRKIRVSIMVSDVAAIKEQHQRHPSIVYDDVGRSIIALDIGSFKQAIPRLHSFLLSKVEAQEITEPVKASKNSNVLKTIHLLTDSLEPKSVIFLVPDSQFQMPIRYSVKNRDGSPTHIKRLYDLAYKWDVPNKKVAYDRNIMSGINTGLFKKDLLEKYLKTNGFKRPTLVKKSEEGEILVLNSEVEVKAELIKNIVPSQHKYLYIDKRK